MAVIRSFHHTFIIFVENLCWIITITSRKNSWEWNLIRRNYNYNLMTVIMCMYPSLKNSIRVLTFLTVNCQDIFPTWIWQCMEVKQVENYPSERSTLRKSNHVRHSQHLTRLIIPLELLSSWTNTFLIKVWTQYW